MLSRRALIAGVAGVLVPPSGARAAIKKLSVASLSGAWRGSETTGPLVIAGEVLFQRNGTYQRMHRLGELVTWASGPYSIAQNWVHFEVEDYGPEYYAGIRQYPPPSETWMVDRFDGRSLDARIGTETAIHYERVI